MAIAVIFDLCFELHLLHVGDELRARFECALSEVLMDSVSFDESSFGIEI